MGMIYRLILADWALETGSQKVLEGEFTNEQIKEYNKIGYNIYFLPNYPSSYVSSTNVDGSHIDIFRFVFLDMDLKDAVYNTKEEFLTRLLEYKLEPTFIVDSGNGIHAYWQISDLDAMSYLRLQRRLIREFNTDDAIAKIYQLMRVPGTINTKNKDNLKECTELLSTDNVYTCEQMDQYLIPITPHDEEYCKAHYNKTYLVETETEINDELPIKFAKLIRDNNEVKSIWSGGMNDRSKSDFRLAHIMFASGFTKEEASSVLVNCAKALERAPKHRISYAMNIINQIWIFEELPKDFLLSKSVKDMLERSDENTLKGTRFACWSYLDNTAHGFRLGQVIGLVAGSGVGKTSVALNMFEGFVQNNPDYLHFFIPLEQPANEIAERWANMCKGKEFLNEKVHVISNYDENGQFRHLSFDDIKTYILQFQERYKRKIGCVVIDHIGALKKKGKDGENQDLMDICHSMKAFAIETNTLLVMQSQAPREKAGIGDLELDKDAAYGTVYFESYCDYLITIWQPLKRVYKDGAPTVTAFKFCKIRHKKQNADKIKEDVRYNLLFDPDTGKLRETTEDEEKSFKYFLSQATNKRKQDKKTDLAEYVSVRWTKEEDLHGKANSNKISASTSGIRGLH